MNGMFVTIVGLFLHRVTLSVPTVQSTACANRLPVAVPLWLRGAAVRIAVSV